MKGKTKFKRRKKAVKRCNFKKFSKNEKNEKNKKFKVQKIIYKKQKFLHPKNPGKKLLRRAVNNCETSPAAFRFFGTSYLRMTKRERRAAPRRALKPSIIPQIKPQKTCIFSVLVNFSP